MEAKYLHFGLAVALTLYFSAWSGCNSPPPPTQACSCPETGPVARSAPRLQPQMPLVILINFGEYPHAPATLPQKDSRPKASEHQNRGLLSNPWNVIAAFSASVALFVVLIDKLITQRLKRQDARLEQLEKRVQEQALELAFMKQRERFTSDRSESDNYTPPLRFPEEEIKTETQVNL